MSDPLLTEMLRMVKFESHLIVVSQWHAKVVMLIGGTKEQHLEVFKKRKIGADECTQMADYLQNDMKHNAAVVLQPVSRPRLQIVCFPKKPNLQDPFYVGTIAHELLHVTIGILTKSDVRLTAASEEAFTYLHGHLMQEAWKRLA